MSLRSYYTVLGVEATATDAEIKRAYRTLAMKFHPDKNPEGVEMFKEISHAYETLSDPQRRAAYDQYGESGAMPEGPSMEEMFGGMFGSGHAGRGPSRKPRAELHPLNVTLEDLFRGRKMRMKLERSIPCSHCKGLGGKKSVMKSCVACGGLGHSNTLRQMGPGLFLPQRVVCQSCQGAGKVIPEKLRCKRCKGSCVKTEADAVEIKIEPGMSDGQRIVLKGKGDQAPGEDAQDLVFVLEQKKHSVFFRAGDDLVAEAEIDLAEALCGFSRVMLKDLKGGPLLVTYKAGVLRPGDVLCLPNEGMPREKRPKDRGDLLVKLHIKFPESRWSPSPALRSMLPATRWPAEDSANAEPEIATGRSMSASEFAMRTSQSSQTHHAHSERGDDDLFEDYEDYADYSHGAPECQQQ
ncbi:DnaJ-like protein xdj1 [Coemansia thaxteri]|uniref:DnaJ-like protein xdj1 n=1 Tax=Coemansia thaxteri TaxID=2663907 RepID=A0A9W8BIN9_9FUNG|nr:DnaJ-like protein xdj1 [Coemansia thaxteri]